MNIDIAEIRKVLKDNKYLVVLKKTSDGCIIETPSAKLLKRPKIKAEIKINKEDNTLIITIGEKSETVDLVDSDIQALMEIVIMEWLYEKINYTYELAEFRNEDGVIVSYTEFFKLFN